MREIDYDAEFDAAVNLFTSFGYFETEDDNQRPLDRVARALRPGAAFLIDVASALGMAVRYQERRWDPAGDDAVMLADHDWDLLAGRNRAVWTFVRADGTRSELRHTLRVYAPWELATMLGRAGLVVEEAFGDFEGAPLTRDSWRLILVARRPG